MLLSTIAAGALTAGALVAWSSAAESGSSGSAGAAAAAPLLEEELDRGAISVRSGDGNLVSWRWLAADADDVAFNVYRDGELANAEPIAESTNFLDEGAAADAEYTVAAVAGGAEQEPQPALAMANGYHDVPIEPPAGGGDYTYSANDASVGDLDGDGDLDFVVKWDPSNAKDNSQSGVTGPAILDGYTLEGERLWRVDLGPNIRSGAHYTQFQVYDYDGDGQAEMAAKTADGTVDGAGTVIGDGSADYVNDGGYILDGPEFLTMFDGATGAALDSVDYVPPRGNVADWGDDYGNRVDRFLAGTAYLDGQSPSLISARGYYTRSVIAAWDFTDGQFSQRWVFDSNDHSGYAGQGSHSLSIADADGDGNDEVMYGSMAVDDDGSGLWNAGTGHGDAQHVGDLDPANEGLEEFKVSEDSSQPGSLFLDAATGDVLWETASGSDNGRGVAADVFAGSPGAESWSAADGALRDPSGAEVGAKPSSINFVSWWDGDPVRELLDDTHIDKYGPDGDERLLTAEDVHSNNGTKATPSLSGDILGDWREEAVWPTSDDTALRIYSTPYETDLRITTLLQDKQYRTALAWQNTAYNQPPHPSFFIGDGMDTPPRPTTTTSE